MSQAVVGSSTPANKKPGNDKPSALDPIQDFIQTAAVHIRRTELFYGWMILLSVLLFSLFLFVLVDHWVWEINRPVRLALWAGLALWSIWWFVRRVLPPMRYKIRPEYAARQFELQDPRSKDSLISWIQLNEPSNPAPKSVLNFVGRYAFGFLRNSDATQVADTANLIRLSAAFFGCLLCTLIYFFASPKSGLVSVSRMLIPWANIAPATRVQFAQITPGATTIMQGSSIPINVTIKGLHKNEKVYLRYDLSDGQVRGEMLPMKEEIQGINYKLDFGKDSGGLHQPLTYWIHAGDAVAGPFDVEIQIVPLVAIDHVDLVFPDYTNLKPRTIQQQGHFEAPEGTIAHIHAISNQAMQTARVEFDPVLQNKLFISAREFLDMKIDNNHLEATWTASIDRKNSIEKKITNYRVHAVNSLKEANHDPVIYQIKIIPDLPPEIEFTGNSNSAVDVPVDQGILLEMTARDPDYGLTAIEVQGSTENRLSPQKPKQLFKETLFEAEEENPRTKNAQYTFLPQQHQLKVGDEIDIVALASDNYHNPISHNLQPQRASSQPIRIRIVEPEIKPDNAQGPNEENPKNEPNIAQSQSPDPKSRIDWDRFRKDTQQNTGKSNSNANEKDTSQNSKGQPDDPQAQRSGQGGTDSGNGKTGSDKSSPNSDSTPSKSSPSGESNPASPNLDGNPRPSNDPNINPSENQSQDPNGSRKQDQTAFEKIQKFMKERQQSGSTDNQPESNQESSDQTGRNQRSNEKNGNQRSRGDQAGTENSGADMQNSDEPGSDEPDSDKAGSDKAGSDKTGSDKAGSDKAGSDKAGSDKAGSDKAGSDKAGSDKAGSDKAGSDKAGSDKAGSDKAGSDKAGSDKAGSDKAGSDKAGSDKAGSDKAGSDKAGAADQQQGSGKSNQENPKSNGNPQKSPEQMGPEPAPNQEQGDGKGSGDEQGGKQGQPQSSEPSSAGSGKNTSGKTPKAGGASSTRPSQSAQFGADQANEEYSKKAADMLLEYIDRQRDQPDPELLNRLNWSQEDFRKFADRWREAKEQAKLNPAKRAELEETLSNLGLAGTGQKINRLKDRNDGLRGMQEEGGRLRPPEALREQFEAFRKAAGKLGK